VAGCCECGDEPSGSGATESVGYIICIQSHLRTDVLQFRGAIFSIRVQHFLAFLSNQLIYCKKKTHCVDSEQTVQVLYSKVMLFGSKTEDIQITLQRRLKFRLLGILYA
jgi:hypothetical protein